MKLKRNVVMLPTNDKANLFINNINSPLLYDNNSTLHRVLLHGRYQHIYITSDEEIKEGDWCIQNGNYLCRITCNQDRTSQGLKKIIATTDKSIAIQHDTLSIPQRKGLINHYPTEKVILPTVSNGFIKKFIERYHAGTPISEVMVEYEEWPVLERITGTEASFRTVVKKLLKVDKNNRITITAVKDSWTKDELDAVLNEFAVKCIKYALHGGLPSDAKAFTKSWIEQNL